VRVLEAPPQPAPDCRRVGGDDDVAGGCQLTLGLRRHRQTIRQVAVPIPVVLLQQSQPTASVTDLYNRFSFIGLHYYLSAQCNTLHGTEYKITLRRVSVCLCVRMGLWGRISRKGLEIGAWSQWSTNMKGGMGSRMVT